MPQRTDGGKRNRRRKTVVILFFIRSRSRKADTAGKRDFLFARGLFRRSIRLEIQMSERCCNTILCCTIDTPIRHFVYRTRIHNYDIIRRLCVYSVPSCARVGLERITQQYYKWYGVNSHAGRMVNAETERFDGREKQMEKPDETKKKNPYSILEVIIFPTVYYYYY